MADDRDWPNVVRDSILLACIAGVIITLALAGTMCTLADYEYKKEQARVRVEEGNRRSPQGP